MFWIRPHLASAVAARPCRIFSCLGHCDCGRHPCRPLRCLRVQSSRQRGHWSSLHRDERRCRCHGCLISASDDRCFPSSHCALFQNDGAESHRPHALPLSVLALALRCLSTLLRSDVSGRALAGSRQGHLKSCAARRLEHYLLRLESTACCFAPVNDP